METRKPDEDQIKPVADKLYEYLQDIIFRPSAASLDVNSLPEAFVNLGKGLQYLSTNLS